MANKLSKRKFRIEVFKGIFQLNYSDKEEVVSDLDNLIETYALTMEDVSDEDKEAICDKCKNIYLNIDEIDALIEDAADNWKLNRIGKVEIAVLRVATYEFKYDKLDAGIVINEALEIAKLYGADKSAGFIHGVLAKIVK